VEYLRRMGEGRTPDAVVRDERVHRLRENTAGFKVLPVYKMSWEQPQTGRT
jgi:hypothetical protein